MDLSHGQRIALLSAVNTSARRLVLATVVALAFGAPAFAAGGEMPDKMDKALDCLEKAVFHGYGHKEWIRHDSDLDSLRELPRFQKLLEAV